MKPRAECMCQILTFKDLRICRNRIMLLVVIMSWNGIFIISKIIKLFRKIKFFPLPFSTCPLLSVYFDQVSLKAIVENIMFTLSLSETRWGWKFGLTPLPSLRSKAHKVIREILPYIRARFAFKLGHADFPTHIDQLYTYKIVLTPDYHESFISNL